MKSLGWRKPTPGLCVAEQHAKAGEQRSVAKAKALNAAKRVAAHLGLKAPERLLLDLLGAFSQPQDWDAGQRPIVWPSNGLLVEQTGFSLSALKRHIRRLAEAGLIAFHNSPNGKRWGRRSADGSIMEAYGFDLSPMAEQAHEFDLLHQRITAERAICKKLKREITALRRGIAANIAFLSEQNPSTADAFLERFDELLIEMPRKVEDTGVLARAISRFTKLDEDVRHAIIEQDDEHSTTDHQENCVGGDLCLHHKENPTGAETEPHIQLTNQHQETNCNATHSNDIQKMVLKANVIASDQCKRKIGKDMKPNVSPAIVFATCPEFASWSLGDDLSQRGERRLFETAERIRPMVGISDNDWHDACQSLGGTTASAALAIIVEKTASGAVRSPAGYLRAIVRKAAIGELHLARSFHGRLAQQAKNISKVSGCRSG